MKNIEIMEVIYGDAKEGIYVNGRIAREGDDLGALAVFEILAEKGYLHFPPIKEYWIDEEWLEKQNHELPKLFKDIPKKALGKSTLIKRLRKKNIISPLKQ